MTVQVEPDYIKEIMRKGVAEFQFEKADKSIRTARGTLSNDFIPESKQVKVKLDESGQPVQTTKKKPSHLVTYYDIDSEGWRSFNVSKFIKFTK